MPEPASLIELLPLVGAVAAITGAISGAITSASITHRLAKQRDQRSRFIDALRQERVTLEGRGDQLDDAFVHWHRASVNRLRGHADALRQHQPKRWAAIADDWRAFEISESVDLATFMFNGGDRSALLGRLDAMMSKLMA